MNDSRSASMVLIVGAAGMAYWWMHLTSGRLSSQNAPRSPPDGSTGDLGAGTTQQSSAGGPGNLGRLLAFAQQWGLRVTSGERLVNGVPTLSASDLAHTGHSPNSLHYSGNAIDVVGSVTDAVQQAAAALGIHVLPELYTGMGPSGYSSGPHYHLSVPQGGGY